MINGSNLNLSVYVVYYIFIQFTAQINLIFILFLESLNQISVNIQLSCITKPFINLIKFETYQNSKVLAQILDKINKFVTIRLTRIYSIKNILVLANSGLLKIIKLFSLYISIERCNKFRANHFFIYNFQNFFFFKKKVRIILIKN
jgi:hypothetical protein